MADGSAQAAHVDDVHPDLPVADLVHDSVDAHVDSQDVRATERALGPGIVGQEVHRCENLAHPVGIILGEALYLREGLGAPR